MLALKLLLSSCHGPPHFSAGGTATALSECEPRGFDGCKCPCLLEGKGVSLLEEDQEIYQGID